MMPLELRDVKAGPTPKGRPVSQFLANRSPGPQDTSLGEVLWTVARGDGGAGWGKETKTALGVALLLHLPGWEDTPHIRPQS